MFFDSTSQKLYPTNRAATFVWRCLEDGMATGEIAHAMHRTLRLSIATARDYVETAIREWHRHGLPRLCLRNHGHSRGQPLSWHAFISSAAYLSCGFQR